jgi:hypothetical protein
MGFVLSLLYFVVDYLTAPVLFGPLAVGRVELILAVLLFFLSLPKLHGSIVLKTPQSVALMGLALAVSLSVLFGEHWAWGAVLAFPASIPFIYAYFLVCLHCNSKKKLQAIVLILLFVCVFVIAQGYIDLTYGVPRSGYYQPGTGQSADSKLWSIEHPYLFVMTNDAGELFYRLRGLGFIGDPNDFGQLLVCVIPLLFIFWRSKKMTQNLMFVMLPVSVLLYGTFLTHSRGALLALISIAVVAARRRIGTLPALLLAGGIFVAAMALHFTGGRDISADSGADRTALWSSGMQMIKSHPLFGVGLGNFADNCDGCGHTAHNSLVVCAAELGMFGLYFWCLFLYPTIRDAMLIASLTKVSEAEPTLIKKEIFSQATARDEVIGKAEVNHLGRLLILSFTGLLVSGWFLSRPYVMTFFLLGGMVEVVYEMARLQGMVASRQRLVNILPNTGILAVSLILLMYILLRITNLMH